MPGSRGRIGPGGVKGQLNFHTSTAKKLASPGQKLVKIKRLERFNKEEI